MYHCEHCADISGNCIHALELMFYHEARPEVNALPGGLNYISGVSDLVRGEPSMRIKDIQKQIEALEQQTRLTQLKRNEDFYNQFKNSNDKATHTTIRIDEIEALRNKVAEIDKKTWSLSKEDSEKLLEFVIKLSQELAEMEMSKKLYGWDEHKPMREYFEQKLAELKGTNNGN